MSRILFVESNTSGTGRRFLETCQQLGYIPTIICSDKARYSFSTSIGEWIEIPEIKVDSIISEINSRDILKEIVAITSTSDYFIELACKIANSLHLHCLDHDTITLCRNKYQFREQLQRAGFPCPKFIRVANHKELEWSSSIFQYPCIVKPISGSGSFQVVKCNNLAELNEFGKRILETEVNERGLPIEKGVLIEEFIEGEEYSAEVFNGNLVGITKKYLGHQPYFVEIGHDFPYIFNENGLDQSINSLLLIVNHFKLNFGPYHIEFKIRNHEIIIIEVNPRLAGGFIPDVVFKAIGVDLISATILNLIGQSPDLTNKCSRFASIRFIVPTKIGTLLNIECSSEIIKQSELVFYKQLPIEIAEIHHDFRDRIGHLIVSGENSKAVKTTSDKLINSLRLNYK